ncbi:MAG: stage V sporulation protein S [bacterium]
MTEKLKVKSGTDPKKLAGAISNIMQKEETKAIHMTAVGAGAVNQAVKSFIIANSWLNPHGIQINMKPHFSTIVLENVDNTERTGINFVIRKETV